MVAFTIVHFPAQICCLTGKPCTWTSCATMVGLYVPTWGVTTSQRPKCPIAFVNTTGGGVVLRVGEAGALKAGRESGWGNIACRDKWELSGLSCGNGSCMRCFLKKRSTKMLVLLNHYHILIYHLSFTVQKSRAKSHDFALRSVKVLKRALITTTQKNYALFKMTQSARLAEG